MRGLKDVMLSPRAQAAVRLALAEDLVSVDENRSSPRRDVTSLALVDAKAVATGEIYAKGTGCVVAGASVAAAVFKTVDPAVKVKILRRDGTAVKPGEPILVFRGKARSILAAERTALNFMQRMCATATLARKFVDATKRYGTLILDTRKTTPGLRVFEKYAVLCGGGSNHRMGMYDRVLMKDKRQYARRRQRNKRDNERHRRHLAAFGLGRIGIGHIQLEAVCDRRSAGRSRRKRFLGLRGLFQCHDALLPYLVAVRSLYSPDSVLMRMTSPSLMKSGTASV